MSFKEWWDNYYDISANEKRQTTLLNILRDGWSNQQKKIEELEKKIEELHQAIGGQAEIINSQDKKIDELEKQNECLDKTIEVIQNLRKDDKKKLAEAVELHEYLSQYFHLPQEAYDRFSRFKASLEEKEGG